MDQTKVSAMVNWRRPQTLKELLRVLGFDRILPEIRKGLWAYDVATYATLGKKIVSSGTTRR